MHARAARQESLGLTGELQCPDGDGRSPTDGTETAVAKKPNQDEQRAAAREAREAGVAPSAAGVTTGASKQTKHKAGSEREGAPKGGKS